jgi:hypothetical protein
VREVDEAVLGTYLAGALDVIHLERNRQPVPMR